MNGLAQHMRPICSHEGGDFHPVDNRVEAGHRVRLRADRIDTGVGSSAGGQVHYAVIDVLVAEIEHERTARLGQYLAFRHHIDGDYPLGT